MGVGVWVWAGAMVMVMAMAMARESGGVCVALRLHHCVLHIHTRKGRKLRCSDLQLQLVISPGLLPRGATWAYSARRSGRDRDVVIPDRDVVIPDRDSRILLDRPGESGHSGCGQSSGGGRRLAEVATGADGRVVMHQQQRDAVQRQTRHFTRETDDGGTRQGTWQRVRARALALTPPLRGCGRGDVRRPLTLRHRPRGQPA